MAQYRWNVDLRENRKQAIHFLTKRVGIKREFLEDVIEDVKQACSPIKHRQRGFSKKMSSERERRRAAELVQQDRRLAEAMVKGSSRDKEGGLQ